jgi:hypothetical protein
MMFVGMFAAPMNHSNAGEAGPDGLKDEFAEYKPRLLKREAVEVEMRLNREAS